jgi:hypothetical protein
MVRDLCDESERLRAALVEAEEHLANPAPCVVNEYAIVFEAARLRVLNRVRAALEAKP